MTGLACEKVSGDTMKQLREEFHTLKSVKNFTALVDDTAKVTADTATTVPIKCERTRIQAVDGGPGETRRPLGSDGSTESTDTLRGAQMTYPPQQPGPYGPGPHGSQGPGPQGPYGPQSGGFPQQSGRYPQTGPQPCQQGAYGPRSGAFPQPGRYGQPSGEGQPGGYGGYPGGGMPPRKKYTGLIIALSVGAVLVAAAVLITGLAAPGWMLSHEKSSVEGGTAKEAAQSIVNALNNQDTESGQKLVCKDATGRFEQLLPPKGSRASLQGNPTVNGNSATVDAKVVDGAGDELGVYHATLNKQDNVWCLKDVSTGVSAGNGSGGSGSYPSSGSDPRYGGYPSSGGYDYGGY